MSSGLPPADSWGKWLLQRVRTVTPVVASVVAGLWILFLVLMWWNWSRVRIIPFWAGICASLPAFLIGLHGLIIVMVKRRVLTSELTPPHDTPSSLEARTKSPESARPRATMEMEAYFDPTTVLTQYGALALLNLVVGIAAFVTLFDGSQLSLNDQDLLLPIRLGVLGAFVFVLMFNLGPRMYQRDVTAGTAVWAAIQIVVGPIIAAVIAFAVKLDTKDGFGAAALYFVAGMTPRIIAEWVQQTTSRVFLNAAPSGPGSRSLPLSQVRGITPAIESRLNEEGVYDVFGLAMANPLRLVRGTPYDLRQIAGWIDEAILITTFPKHWAALEDEGFTGAIDVAWAIYKDEPAEIVVLHRLADRLKIDKDSLVEAARRLRTDAQVATVWILYQRTLDGTGPGTDK